MAWTTRAQQNTLFEHRSGTRLRYFCCSMQLLCTVPLRHSCNYGVKEYSSVFDSVRLMTPPFATSRAEAEIAL